MNIGVCWSGSSSSAADTHGLGRNLVRLYFTNLELEIILLGQQGTRQEHSDMAAYGIVNIYAKSAFCTNYIRLIMTETET